MGKKKIEDRMLPQIIYRSIFDIIDDETGNPSYRKYFDKVLKDIFGVDGIITSMMLSTDQFKFIKKLLKDNEYKAFCQMMLRDEDVKSIKDLVRVAYDAAQIANKPKKRVSTNDIKAYRYLTKLYTKGIEAMRKKYKTDKSSKKAFKQKYSDLNKMLGKSVKESYHYDLGYSDEDEGFGDLFEDDEPEDEDDQFDPMNDFDLGDLPAQFTIESKDDMRNLLKKPTKIIDGDEQDLQIYDDSDDDEEDTTDEPLIMPEGQFQRYSMSIFEKLLEHLENEKNPQNVNILGVSNLSPVFSDDQINWCSSPVNENGIRSPFMMKDGRIYHNEGGFNIDGSKIIIGDTYEELPILTDESDVINITDLTNIPKKQFFKTSFGDQVYYADEEGVHPVNSDTGEIDEFTVIDFGKINIDTENMTPSNSKKEYTNMTREQIINEFNSMSDNPAALSNPTTEPTNEAIKSDKPLDGELKQ